MSAIQTLCHRAVLLCQGKIDSYGSTAAIINKYLARSTARHIYHENADQPATAIIHAQIEIDEDSNRAEFVVTLWVRSLESMSVAVDVRLADVIGTPIAYGSLGAFSPSRMVLLRPGVTVPVLRHDMQNLATGSYSLSLDITRPNLEYIPRAENCLEFECDTPTLANYATRIDQSWGKGCWELPTTLEGIFYECSSTNCNAEDTGNVSI